MRVITRLDETCREVRDAARVIGDAELFKKMEEAQNKIKRDSECELIRVMADNDDRDVANHSCIRGEFVLLKQAEPRLPVCRKQHGPSRCRSAIVFVGSHTVRTAVTDRACRL